jgi:hypothetical protein
MQRNAERLQQGTQCEMVVLVACEVGQVENDHEMDTTLVQTAEREQLLELAAVCGLGTFAFLVKAFENVIVLSAAVLLARTELCGQAEILGLLLRAVRQLPLGPDGGLELLPLLRSASQSIDDHCRRWRPARA